MIPLETKGKKQVANSCTEIQYVWLSGLRVKHKHLFNSMSFSDLRVKLWDQRHAVMLSMQSVRKAAVLPQNFEPNS